MTDLIPSDVVKAIQDSVQTAQIGEFYTRPVFRQPIPAAYDATVEVSTLQGIIDYLNNDPDLRIERNPFVHIASPSCVEILQKVDLLGYRATLLVSDCRKYNSEFDYARYMPIEDFIVSVMSKFEESTDQRELLELCSEITQENTKINLDNGVTQTVSITKGIKSGTAKLKPIVSLAPYRTFPELTQPLSKFVFRLRGGDTPTAALFTAGDARWRLEAMSSIRTWLLNHIEAEVSILS